MNVLAIIFILFCGASGFQDVSGSISKVFKSGFVQTQNDGFDIKGEDETSKNKRARRYSASEGFVATMDKAEAAIDALKTSYLYRSITNGNFVDGTVRSYNILKTDKGKGVFGTLDGDLNESFRSITGRRPRTGDIISCRIPSSRMAKHYMMVLNKKIIEVAVVGGKSTHDGVVLMDSFRKSSYINSTECLYHENRVMARAEKIDDEKGDDTESDLKLNEILNRINCTISGSTPGRFHYDLLSCNCQDVVLYWAYGYAENTCLKKFGCFNYLTYSFDQIYRYVDEEAFNVYEELKDTRDLFDATAKVLLPLP